MWNFCLIFAVLPVEIFDAALLKNQIKIIRKILTKCHCQHISKGLMPLPTRSVASHMLTFKNFHWQQCGNKVFLRNVQDNCSSCFGMWNTHADISFLSEHLDHSESRRNDITERGCLEHANTSGECNSGIFLKVHRD